MDILDFEHHIFFSLGKPCVLQTDVVEIFGVRYVIEFSGISVDGAFKACHGFLPGQFLILAVILVQQSRSIRFDQI